MTVKNLSFSEFVAHIGIMKPNQAKPQDPKAFRKLDSLLDSDEYILEEKIDGCRYKLLGHRFFSADNHEKTENFPHLTGFFKNLAMHNLILDGEIHYPGKTSQYATHVTNAHPSAAMSFQQHNGFIHYTIFDILRTPKANWAIRNTYAERRKLLRYFYDTFIAGTEMAEYIHLVPMTADNKRRYLEELLSNGFEGGVLKKIDSQYYMGKKPMWQWMKIKQEDEVDLIITGFEPAKVLYEGDNISNWTFWKEIDGISRPVTKWHYYGWIGSVVLSAYVNGTLTRICTSSGMSEDIRQDMTMNPQNYLNKVARITFMETTEDGYPRHPRYKNLHETKQPQECTWSFK